MSSRRRLRPRFSRLTDSCAAQASMHFSRPGFFRLPRRLHPVSLPRSSPRKRISSSLPRSQMRRDSFFFSRSSSHRAFSGCPYGRCCKDDRTQRIGIARAGCTASSIPAQRSVGFSPRIFLLNELNKLERKESSDLVELEQCRKPFCKHRLGAAEIEPQKELSTQLFPRNRTKPSAWLTKPLNDLCAAQLQCCNVIGYSHLLIKIIFKLFNRQIENVR